MRILLTQTAAIDGREMHAGQVVEVDPVFGSALIETGFAKLQKSEPVEISAELELEIAATKPKRKR